MFLGKREIAPLVAGREEPLPPAGPIDVRPGVTVWLRGMATPGEALSEHTAQFDALVRIDTPGEADYYRNGGILPYVLRSLV